MRFMGLCEPSKRKEKEKKENDAHLVERTTASDRVGAAVSDRVEARTGWKRDDEKQHTKRLEL